MSILRKASFRKFNIFLPIKTIIACLALLVYIFRSRNRSVIAPELALKTSLILHDGKHNGFPDMIHWQGNFYLAFRAARRHIDRNSSIKILRSSDAEHWQLVAQMDVANEDVRDPKFAAIDGRLFLYALKVKRLRDMPYTTIFSTSEDGISWGQWQDVSPANWVFWRPKTDDGQRWYVAADDRKRKRSALFSSTDGITWDRVSTIYSGEFNAEIELSFLANKDMVCTVRVEGVEGDPKTMIGQAAHPYETWTLTSSRVTRLDGACSFTHRDQVLSAGRFEPGPLSATMGHLLNRKRTSLFLVRPHEIVWLSDLPSSGDTGYASALVLGDRAFIVYYTSDPRKDDPWLLGQFKPTQLWLAQVDLEQLELLASTR